MNERDILKNSIFLFLIGLIGMGLLSVFLQDSAYVVGFVLGYILNIVVFLLIIKMSEGILTFSMSTALAVLMSIGKLGLYALGFYLSMIRPEIHVIGVFLGYMVIKLTIYTREWLHKEGGEFDV